jgi:putative phosphoesterase
MKIAVLSDIHGNDIALRNVLAEAAQQHVERVFVLGDIVGYYYHPDAVLALLSEWNCNIIQGNHERLMLEAQSNEARAVELTAKYGSGLRIALIRLSPEQVQTLAELPVSAEVAVDGVRCFLTHGAPLDPDQYTYPDSDVALLDRCGSVDADFVFIGHSHYPFVYRGPKAQVVNVGSVGQARDRGGFASWALLDTDSRTVTHKSTPFDPTEILEEIQNIDPHLPYLGQVLRRK